MNPWEKYLMKNADEIWNNIANSIMDLNDKDGIFVLSMIIAKASLSLSLRQKYEWEQNND